MLECAILEQLGQPWNRTRLLPAGPAETRIVAGQFFCRMLGDLAAPAGGAFERRIVDDHQLAVTGQVQVQLTTTYAVLQTLLEAREGIFRCFTFGATMAVDQGHGRDCSCAVMG